jgi:hypothetical protein
MSDGEVHIFKLTPPAGEPFTAAVVNKGGGLAVYSKRGADWAPEKYVTVADLVMPEQRLGDWTVEEVKPAA